MVMFSTFEHSVDQIYARILQKQREDCSRAQQLGVTCLAGYTAGAVATVISNPADNIVSSLYNSKTVNILQVSQSKDPLFPETQERSLMLIFFPDSEEHWICKVVY